MAKSLEEHLYRSAQSKAEYLDLATLKRRLQAIAHGLELHRSNSSMSMKRSESAARSQNFQGSGSHPSSFAINSINPSAPASQQQNASWGNVGSGNTNVSSSNMANLAAHLNRGTSNNTGSQMHASHQGNNNLSAQQRLANHGAINAGNQMDVNAMTSQGNLSHHSSANNMNAQQGNLSHHGSNTSLNAHGAVNAGNQMNLSHHGSQNNMAGNVSDHGSFTGTRNSAQHPSFVNSANAAQAPVAQHQNASWSNQNANVANSAAQMNPSLQGNMHSMAGQQQGVGNFSSMMGQQNNNVCQHVLLATQQQQQQSAAEQQQQQLAAQQEMTAQQMDSSWLSIGSVAMPPPAFGGSSVTSHSQFQEGEPPQKKKVIMQQQQRLLLLRHASKCKFGPACETKFCSEMVTLWNHMKGCRNKNCETSHCRSSRCVLNHYRICKSQGKTTTCEVCGPVMAKIKRQERDTGGVDPLARDQELTAIGQVAEMPGMSHQSEKLELQQLQEQQLKLQGQLDSLKQLEKQQEQLLEQQRRLQDQARYIKNPNSPQAQQLQQQQMLLQQLQKRCQQQQMLLQQVLQMPPNGGGQSGLDQQRGMSPLSQPGQQPVAPLPGVSAAKKSLPGVSAARKSAEAQQKPKTLAAAGGKDKRISKGKGKRNMGKGKVLSDPSTIELPSASRKRSPTQSATRAPKKPRSMSKDALKTDIAALKSSAPKDDGSFIVQPDSPQDMSLITVMTKDAIEKHLESLNKGIKLSSRTVTHTCLPVIQDLIDNQFGWVFHDAVDPVALGLPDYFDVVKTPMHLELVKKKLDNAIYSDMSTFARDVKLVFENAILYNGENSEVGALAQTMLVKFAKMYTTLVQGKVCKLLFTVRNIWKIWNLTLVACYSPLYRN